MSDRSGDGDSHREDGIPDEDPYEHPDRWSFYCDDCDRGLTAEEAQDHQDDHRITEEYRP